MSHFLYGLVLVLHVLVGLFLIGVVLLQGGRGGMGEAFAGGAAQSLFGGGANTVITKITAVSAGLFMVTCLSLAALSTDQGRSVIDQLPTTLPDTLPSLPGVMPSEQGTPKLVAPPSTTQQPGSEPPSPISAPSHDSSSPAR